MTCGSRNVLFPFRGEEFGGSHISSIGLIKALDRKLWRPIVVLLDGGGELAALLTAHGIDFVAGPSTNLPGRLRIGSRTGFGQLAMPFLGCIGPFTRFLRENQIAIVHTNDGEMHAAWSLPARLAGVRHVWHHRADPETRGVNLLAPILASHIVSVSGFASPASPILPISHKLSVIHSPFDHPMQTPDRSEARRAVLSHLGLREDTRILSYFGTLIARKRPRVFIDVVRRFTERYPDVPVAGLVFGVPVEDVGADRTAEAYARDLGIGDKIHFMGFRSPVETWMCGTDVLLVPAVREPFGRTLIEAMLLGTPVVATNSGGNPEAIENEVTGFLVPPDDPDAFLEPVHRILTDRSLRNRIAEAAGAAARSAYSTSTHVQKISDLYASLLRHKTAFKGSFEIPRERRSSP
ncbi:glycosyltransferase family 4 protein [Arvimicrobium flavum]|uniref:glycosyltransferase family 4 protein n=1 Tax=Arvimicrobium flavum TaxID=3393320 RepID=UPI00237B9545|nr:glycosyltransferase family 4 protein [Mesorhizobium shangrilense]